MRLTERGTFSCPSWGELRLDFVILGTSGGEPREIVEVSGALLLGILSPSRLGALTSSELRHLVRAAKTMRGASALDAGAIVEHITASRN